MSWIIAGDEKNGLLDIYPGAAAAYSLRNLQGRSGKDSAVVRVRRDNDDTEADFTAAEVSDGTLAAWVGAGNDGFVRTWYDQSGNNYHAIQATGANQPKIVNSGSLVEEGGKTVIEFDGINDSLRADSLASGASGTDIAVSAFCLWSTASPASPYDVIFGFGNTANPNSGFWAGGGGGILQLVRKDNTGGLLGLSANVQSTQALLIESVLSIGDTTSFYYNGSLSQSGTESLENNTLNTFAIGSLVRTSVGNELLGNVSELILYYSNQSTNRDAIESNINAHYNIF